MPTGSRRAVGIRLSPALSGRRFTHLCRGAWRRHSTRARWTVQCRHRGVPSCDSRHAHQLTPARHHISDGRGARPSADITQRKNSKRSAREIHTNRTDRPLGAVGGARTGRHVADHVAPRCLRSIILSSTALDGAACLCMPCARTWKKDAL